MGSDKGTSVIITRGREIENALLSGRQYLTGRIQNQQYITAVDEDLEVGLSEYRTAAYDTPHYHKYNTIHWYILSGEVRLLLLEENKEHILKAGDFCVISPGTTHVMKAKPKTRILFIKSPGGNDKVTVSVNYTQRHWMESCEDGTIQEHPDEKN